MWHQRNRSFRQVALLLGLALLLVACPAEEETVDDDTDDDLAEEFDDLDDEVDDDVDDDTDDPAEDEPEEADDADVEVTEGEPLPTIEITTTTEGYDPIRYEAAFIIEEAWEELGFDVEVEPTDFATSSDAFYEQQDFHAQIHGWSGRVDRLDPQHFLGTLYGPNSDLGGNNPGGYENAEFDELFVDQREELDEDSRVELVHEMQDIVADEVPLDILFLRDETVAHNNATFDGYVEMPGEGLYNEWTPYEVEPQTDDAMLTIGTPEEPDSINPLVSTTVWGWKFMRMYYDKLIRLDPDAEPVEWAAESIETPDDVTYEVTLRDGMTFHDGEPVTADDVAFSYNYMLDNQFGYFMPFIEMIADIETDGDDTVTFHLEEPFGPFINVTFAQIPILPEHEWADIDAPQDLGPDEVPTVGSGPFEFETWDTGEYKSMVRNDDHWTADDISIDGMEYIIYADAEGMFTGAQTEEIDMTAWRVEPGQITQAEDEDHLEIVDVPDFGYYHLTYNLREEPFDDMEVRRALSHAIDKEQFVDVLLDGRGEPGASLIASSNALWHNPDVTEYPFDLDDARSMLEEAGYGWDDEGNIVDPN